MGTNPAAATTEAASVHLTGDLVEISKDSVVTFQLKDVSGQPADMRVLTTATTVWMDAFNSGDAVTIAGLSSEDGALLPPNGRAIIGRQAIYSYWNDLLTDSDTKVELVNVETVVEGDLGYKAGRFELLDATGAAIDQGKYIQIWKRSPQGYWELHRDMWNSSLVAAKAGSSARRRQTEIEDLSIELEVGAVEVDDFRNFGRGPGGSGTRHGHGKLGAERDRLRLRLQSEKLDLDDLGFEPNPIVAVEGLTMIVPIGGDRLGDSLGKSTAASTVCGSMATPHALRDSQFAVAEVDIAW